MMVWFSTAIPRSMTSAETARVGPIRGKDCQEPTISSTPSHDRRPPRQQHPSVVFPWEEWRRSEAARRRCRGSSGRRAHDEVSPMARRRISLPTILLTFALGGSGPARAQQPPSPSPGKDIVKFTILQMNDVYEIEPLNHGAVCGLARVAYVRQQLLEDNPNTITVLAGDFLNPSAMGTARVNGEELAGRQMVAVMNALGLDYATFGNHEFDLGESAFFRRLKESRFRWFASNVALTQSGRPYTEVPVPDSIVHEIRSPKGGRNVRVGLFGLTFDLNYKTKAAREKEEAEKKAAEAKGQAYRERPRVPYAAFSPTLPAARAMVAKLRDREKADIVIAVTHLPLDPDRTLDPDSSCDLEVSKVPGIDLILGGHEHVSVFRSRLGVASTPIFKADANARTVYIHQICFDRAAGKIDRIDSYLKAIAADIPDEPGTAGVVRAWHDRAFRAFRAERLDPERPIARIEDPLEGREEKVRAGPTNLTRLIGRAMLRAVSTESDPAAWPGLAVFNSGSIRLDDLLVPGVVSEYDVKRILPYDGKIIYAKVQGDVISRLLDKGTADRRRGTGGYLQITGARLVNEEDGGQFWETDAGVRIQRDTTLYPIVFNDYLLMTHESGFDAPMPATPRPPLRQVGQDQQEVGGMQKAVIAQFLFEFGPPQPDPTTISTPVAPSPAEGRPVALTSKGAKRDAETISDPPAPHPAPREPISSPPPRQPSPAAGTSGDVLDFKSLLVVILVQFLAIFGGVFLAARLALRMNRPGEKLP